MENLAHKNLIDALRFSESDPLGKFGPEPPPYWGKGINEMARYGFAYPSWGVPLQNWQTYRQSENIDDRRGLGPDGGDNDPRKYEWKQLVLPEKPVMFGDDIESFIRNNAQHDAEIEQGGMQNGFVPFSQGLFGLGRK